MKDVSNNIKENKSTFVVYVILRVIVIAALVVALWRKEFYTAFFCVLTLILFLLPAIAEKAFKIELPSVLEIIVLLFIFAAEILGEIACFYVRVPHWDTILHTVNGFLCAAVGFALVDLLNENKNIKFQLSPIFVAIVAFCFSMTIGIFWEFFEFGSDMLLKTDMQKDFIINSINSVALDPANTNKTIHINDIESISINGKLMSVNGYIDIGLIDTMKDLIVNFIGAAVFSFIGFFYIKSRGKGKFAEKFIPKMREAKNTE
jgi:hypothetical protein